MNTALPEIECTCPTAVCEHTEDNPDHDPGFRANHAPGSFLGKRDLRPERPADPSVRHEVSDV